jgi:RNA polymerase sigma factor (sigma-70 family)
MTNRLSAVLVRSVHETDVGGNSASDCELVERFAERGDAEAFAALVRRHGAMVLGVCRRVLRHEQNAEDVFQAVFLVLSRKAGALNRADAVGPWLFGVARRLSLRARQTERQRQERNSRAAESCPAGDPNPDPLDDLTLREAGEVLDEELARLPERVRGPLVLCYLEGLTRDEAAARLGCPRGTLKGRLERGRALLEQRLSRRGLALTAVLPALVLTRAPASAVPAALQSTAVEAALAFAGRASGRSASPAAAALAEGALRPSYTFAVVATVLLAVAACGFGAGLIASRSEETRAKDRPVDPPAAPPRATARPAGERPAGVVPALAPLPLAPAPTEKLAARKDKDPEPLPTQIQGVAKAVDAEKGTIVVVHREGEDTYAVTPDVRIEIDGAPGELSGVPAGANVHLTRFVDAKTVGNVQAGGRAYFGNLVRAVDVQKRTVTIRDRDGDSTFAVAENALIWIDGKAAKLDEIPVGSFVNLGLAADQHTVRHLGADGPCLGGCGGSLVSAVNVQERTITFDKKAAPDVADKTFTVAPDAHITINGNRAGTLEDVPVGCYVGLLLRVDRKTVGRVAAQGPSNLCDPGGSALKAIDPEKGTVTFDDSAGGEVAGRTFTLAKDVNIIVDGKSGKLSALTPGTLVDIRLWVDGQTIGQISTCGQPVPGGVVTAVDLAKGTVTVGDKTYPVARDANIVIDGKPVGLAGVPVGTSVALKLTVDRQTVGTIFQAHQ